MLIRWKTPRQLLHDVLTIPCWKVVVVLFTMVVIAMVTIPPGQDPVVYDPMLLSRKHTRSLERHVPSPDRTYIINPTIGQTEQPPYIVVFVQSHPNHHDQRDRIRRTWGNSSNYGDFSMRVIFSMGLQLQSSYSNPRSETAVSEEARKHGDVLLLNFVDQYDLLTLKGLLTLRWIAQNFVKTKYVFKTDDDVLLNMFAWHKIIRAIDSRNLSCFVAGYMWMNPRVFRSGKYKVPFDDYPLSRHPSFCSGAGYVMTRRAVLAAIEASKYLPLHIRDDPFYTGIIAQAMGIDMVAVDSLTFHIGSPIQNLCKWLLGRPKLVLHDTNEAAWEHAWRSLMEHEQRWPDDSQPIDIDLLTDSEKGTRFDRLSRHVNHSLQHECTGTSRPLRLSVYV